MVHARRAPALGVRSAAPPEGAKTTVQLSWMGRLRMASREHLSALLQPG
jgi:hypothetical protein